MDSHDASSVTFQVPHVGLLQQPSLHYPDRCVRLDRCEDDLYSKNQKLFSKIWAQTVGHRWITDMAMKASQIQSHGGTEALKLIAASNGVKKLGPKEGRTKQVGDVRLTWKATGEDTGYATSFYEMDLPPGKGIALHSHPYAEVFYVVIGHTDFLRVDEQGQEEWVRCGPGDTLVAPMNALHAFHNRTDKPSRFISSSVYYHEVFFELYALTVDVNDPLPSKKEPTEAEGEQYLQLLKNAMKVHMYAPQVNASSGLEVLRELEKRNSNSGAHGGII
jgi:quercetin dioxygenase-like cupin family protein